MSYEVLFISEEKVKNFTTINEGVYVSDLVPGIIQTQDLDLQPILGSKFYNGLKDRVLAGTQTADETTLLDDFIAPFLLQRALWRILPNIKWKLLNKSVLSPTSETAATISLEEFQYLRGEQANVAVWYENRLKDYLIEYSNLYPEYNNPDMRGIVPDKGEVATNQFAMPSENTKGPRLFGRRNRLDCNDCGYYI